MGREDCNIGFFFTNHKHKQFILQNVTFNSSHLIKFQLYNYIAERKERQAVR